MTERMSTELELALMDQLEKEQSPERKLVNKVENHINTEDIFLQAVLDVAEAGRQAAEGDRTKAEERFNTIIGLLEGYRERHSHFIESLYRKKRKGD